MPKLSPLKANEVMRKLRVLGYTGPIPGGRHAHMVHHLQKKVIPIPTHGSKDIGVVCCEKSYAILVYQLKSGKISKRSH